MKKLNFPGIQSSHIGKVRDSYVFKNGLILVHTTDRISAYDQVLTKTIPHKGQVLNEMASYFLEATKDIVPNWLLETPVPQISIGHYIDLQARPENVWRSSAS